MMNETSRANVESWRQQVEETLSTEGPVSTEEPASTDGVDLAGDLTREMDKGKPVVLASTEVKDETREDASSSLEELLNVIDSIFEDEIAAAAAATTTASKTKESIAEKENHESDNKLQEKESRKDKTDQEAIKMAEMQKYIAQQKQAAREKATTQANDQPNQPGKVDDVIRRCLLSAIPSLAASPGTDILELVNLDVVVGHLGLNIDLSDSWERALMPNTAVSSIEDFFTECAPDPYAWSIIRRGFLFTQHLWMTVREFDPNEDRPKNREWLIGVLEALAEVFKGELEWEIVSENVPRAIVRRAIAVAKDGADPPNFEWGEDSEIDPFLMMLDGKSDSSLFGTPDSDHPRYWNYWMNRGRGGSNSS